MSDYILLNSLNNNLNKKNKYCTFRITKNRYLFLNFLVQNGLISNVIKEKNLTYGQKRRDNKTMLRVNLKYTTSFNRIIQGFKIISKPGKPIYFKLNDLYRCKECFFILSTPQGFQSTLSALKNQVGGKVICQIIF